MIMARLGFTAAPEVIFESYLHKTPPLDKLFMNWKKRWFVLSRSNPIDASSVELSYYSDPMKNEKKGSIDLKHLVGIHPAVRKSKDHVFTIEAGGRKFVLKAPDENTKNIWVAKLREICGQDQSYHVTVPSQLFANYSEALLTLSTPGNVSVISPTNGELIVSIPFQQIRRLGAEVAYTTDIIWFETCQCNSDMGDFVFLTVSLGFYRAVEIVQEIKGKIEMAIRALLILEHSDDTQLAYIARKHYGCQAFPGIGKDRILRSGIASLQDTWVGTVSQKRRQSEFHIRQMDAMSQPRRHTIVPPIHQQSSRSPQHSPSRSPHHSPSPSPSPSTSPSPSSKRTLEQMRNRPPSSSSSGGSKSGGSRSDSSYTAGLSLQEFDAARNSAPSYLTPYRSTVTQPASPHRKPTLEQFRQQSRSIDSHSGRRLTLEQLHQHRSVDDYDRGRHRKTSRGGFSKDSGFATGGDIAEEDDVGVFGSTNILGYDNLEPATASPYDHLTPSPKVPPRSLASLAM